MWLLIVSLFFPDDVHCSYSHFFRSPVLCDVTFLITRGSNRKRHLLVVAVCQRCSGQCHPIGLACISLRPRTGISFSLLNSTDRRTSSSIDFSARVLPKSMLSEPLAAAFSTLPSYGLISCIDNGSVYGNRRNSLSLSRIRRCSLVTF